MMKYPSKKQPEEAFRKEVAQRFGTSWDFRRLDSSSAPGVPDSLVTFKSSPFFYLEFKVVPDLWKFYFDGNQVKNRADGRHLQLLHKRNNAILKYFVNKRPVGFEFFVCFKKEISEVVQVVSLEKLQEELERSVRLKCYQKYLLEEI
jgi:hypothetical protein